MKKKIQTTRKRLLSVLLAVAMVLAALPLTALPAVAATSGDFNYAVLSEADKTCEITGYTGSATVLTIPSELDGYTVTSISYEAFDSCKSLTEITIANSITSILNRAFRNCTSLKSITIPDSITIIRSDAFYNCSSLTGINISQGNQAYISENGVLLNKAKTHLVCYPAGKQGQSYTIPSSVVYIDGCAFNNCASLANITIPDSVTSIDESAFTNCTGLTNITIPNSVTSIGEDAFSGCTSLTSVTIPNSVRWINGGVFKGCTSLTSITIPNSVRYIDVLAFYNTAYYNTESNWENDVLYIGNHLIEAKNTLSGAYTIRLGTKTIAGDAFFDCSALTNITIPDSVVSIGAGAFQGCDSLTKIVIPDGVTSVDSNTFSGCISLQNVTIPNSVTEICQWAFGNCTSLTSIVIPDGVTCISKFAFYGCSSLSSVTLPKSLIYRIDNTTFFETNLTTVYGYTGSYAETFANTNGYTFLALDLVKNDETDISVVFPPENLPAENTVLNVEKLSAEENTITYDITLTINGEAVQPASAVTVKIPVPAGMDGTQCKVYRQEADGTYTDMQATYQDGYMVFTTDHFSTYVLTTADPNAPTYTLGDVNGDDKINAVDARWVLQAASGARTFDATQTAAADVNGDGKVNAVDARWILQVASGARTL